MEAPLLHFALVGTPNAARARSSTHSPAAVKRSRTIRASRWNARKARSSRLWGVRFRWSICPAACSLRGRSPDEEITRDMVLGRTPGEAVPDLVLCVADSTNLRLTIRLLLERKSTGRPLMLVLNMFDIATRRGVTVDVARLSEALGVPVVTSIAAAQGRYRRTTAPDRRNPGAGANTAGANISGSRSRSPDCGPRSARPIASSRPMSACRRGPTPGPRGSTPWYCTRWRASQFWRLSCS